MGVNSQRHAPGRALATGKGPPVPIVQEAGWAPEPVWTQRVQEKSFCLCQGSNLNRLVVELVARHYTAWATRLTIMYTTWLKFSSASQTKNTSLTKCVDTRSIDQIRKNVIIRRSAMYVRIPPTRWEGVRIAAQWVCAYVKIGTSDDKKIKEERKKKSKLRWSNLGVRKCRWENFCSRTAHTT
jgi:hypothetical protein